MTDLAELIGVLDAAYPPRLAESWDSVGLVCGEPAQEVTKVVFAVDAVYLFPWATIFAEPEFGTTTLIEMFVFLGLLATGILYAVRRKVLTWQ